MEICHHATRRSAPLRSGLTARLAPAPLGGLRPPAARSAARASRRPPGASGWLGGSAHALPGLGPPLAARLGARKPRLPRPAAVFGPLGRLAALFALSAPGARPAAAVPCVAAVAPARGPRRGFAAPVRRLAPSGFALPGAGPPLLAPRSGARPLCALSRSAGSRCRRLPSGPPSRRCGLPVRSPLLCLGLALVQRVGRGGLAAGPLSRLRARRLLARPRRGPSGRFLLRGGGLLLRAVRLRPACCLRRGFLRRGLFLGRAAWACVRLSPHRCCAQARYTFRVGEALPCAPPPRRPRWGLRGA